MTPLPSLAFALLSLAPLAGRHLDARAAVQGAAVQRTTDPEANPEGRRTYLGRRIAQTMHWTGAKWLMRETREDEENGARLLKWLDVQPGATVADLGCGNGYHALPMAKAVGPEGKVLAVDLQKEMLEFLAQRAAAEAAKLAHPLQIEPILATVDDPKLPPNSCDFVLMVDVYHELSHPVRVLGAIRKALRKDGVVVLVEFRAEDKAVPIKPLHKMSKAQMIAEMAAGGFTLAAETDELPWQHAMAFMPVASDAKEPKEPVGNAPPATPLAAAAMTRGFMYALTRDDPRIAAPFLAEEVCLDRILIDTGKAASLEIGHWMRDTETPLIPEGTTYDLQLQQSGWVKGRLTPPQGQTIFEDRTVIELVQNEAGLWLVTTWQVDR